MIIPDYRWKWGLIPLCLSGCFVGSGSSGIRTGSHLQKDV